MDGSSVIFIVIPLVLFTGIALPYIADRRSGGKRSGQRAARGPAGCPADQRQPLTDFRYRDKGVVAVLGRGDAVAELPLIPGAPGRYQLRIRGRLAWLLWLGVHIVYLIGFRNRLQVLIDWGGTTPAAPARSCWNNPRDAIPRPPWPISRLQPAELMSRGSGGRAHKAAAADQQAMNGTSTAR